MKSQTFVSLGKIIDNALIDLKKDGKNGEDYIFENWKDIVGLEIAKVTKPVNRKFDTLLVNVENPAWLHQLSFIKKELLVKINRHNNQALIEKIHFRIGQVK